MDNFTRLKKIGRGNFGDVWLVERKSDGHLFAIKKVDLEFHKVDPLNEVNLLKSLDHPNIIKYYDAFKHNDKLCIVMEYADNFDLSHKIKECKLHNRYLDEETIIRWFTQICLAVHYLHSKKVLHRDIKLQNIFLSKEGIIKMGDFSISKQLENTQDLANTSIGTPFYLSPEICQAYQYNHKIDIWMLGCVLFELCTLEKPFQGDSLNNVIQKILYEQTVDISSQYSPYIHDLIRQMLRKEPEGRPEASQLLKISPIQKELKKLINEYQKSGYKLDKDFLKQRLSLIQCPQFQEEDSPDDASKNKKKQSQNSLQFLVEQAKLHNQTPFKPHAKTPSQYSNIKKIDMTKQLTPSAFTTSNTHLIMSQQNSPSFTKMNFFFDKIQLEQQQLKQSKGKSYQREISINTQLDKKDHNEQEENLPKTQVKPKSFGFADQIFNPKAPASPNRTLLLSDFLKRKLGEESFNQMKAVYFSIKPIFIQLLEGSNDPLKLLEERRGLIAEIIGEHNLDCIKVFKVLITSQITPTGSHSRTKSAQSFYDDQIHGLSKNPAFEVSFKNLQTCNEWEVNS